MNCCSPSEPPVLDAGRAPGGDATREEVLLASRAVVRRMRHTELSVPNIQCGACIGRIERALNALAGVDNARVNLSTKRVAVRWRAEGPPPPLVETLTALGYDAHLHDSGADEKDRGFFDLVRALAVAGFAAGNIMMLSVSVWAGAEPQTRELLHWLSALIALPALAYSGRVFFRSAWRSLKHGQTNMDVPISIGVLLAFGMSLYETVHHGEHAYFDAAVSLLFFLLVGRTLDHMMREKARAAVKGLAKLGARGAMILHTDGTRSYLQVGDIKPGMTILLAAAERVPVDAVVERGSSDLDCSLVSGESALQSVGAGSAVRAGTLNLTGPLTMTATAAAKDSFLADMVRLMEAAERGKGGYRRIADRAARLYAPVVHLTALFSFMGWLAATGDFHRAMTIAVAVLIITCPCALGLAVPMVQVVAARRLFENGIMMKDGSAMERLIDVDTVVFDKTGTLTLGVLELCNHSQIAPETLVLAATMAAHSNHPHSRTLASAGVGGILSPAFDSISEHPGQGLKAKSGAVVFRLGRADWALDSDQERSALSHDIGTVLSKDGKLVHAFLFKDRTRPDARDAVRRLAQSGLAVEVVSGDRPAVVRQLASALGIETFQADVLPWEKVARIASLAASGHKILMVGDGLNDAPALAAAHVSMAPATAADIGRNAADFVFLHKSLDAVPQAMTISREAARLIRQNFGLAIAYNAIALPIAILGHVTPLVAALAMSGSSIIVVANALRLGNGKRSFSLWRRKIEKPDRAPPFALESAQ